MQIFAAASQRCGQLKLCRERPKSASVRLDVGIGIGTPSLRQSQRQAQLSRIQIKYVLGEIAGKARDGVKNEQGNSGEYLGEIGWQRHNREWSSFLIHALETTGLLP